jgi:hypothetical protein
VKPIFSASAAAILLVAAGAIVPLPTSAQSTGETINALIVYGEDPCPVSTQDQITVCARKEESERYRIPEVLRESVSPQNEAWNNKVLAYETVFDTGTLSCSPTGPGGFTGCTQNMIDQAYAEKRTDASVRFAQLIEEERARRLATIDAEAQTVQADVEEAEKQYFDEKAAPPAAASSAPAPAPASEHDHSGH